MIMTAMEVEVVQEKEDPATDAALINSVNLKENVDFDRAILNIDKTNLFDQIDQNVNLSNGSGEKLTSCLGGVTKEKDDFSNETNNDDNNNKDKKDKRDLSSENCETETNHSVREYKEACTTTMRLNFEEKAIQVEDQTKTELILKVRHFVSFSYFHPLRLQRVLCNSC